MDFFAFPPIAALLSGAYWLVENIAALLEPFAGSLSAALAVVVLTLLVRALLIPVSISQVKAEWTRRRLAPKLAALQARYTKNPELLQKKIAELYKSENTSPFAGILPTLLQAPVVSVVYGLFIRGTIGGHANALLGATLIGVPLGATLFGSFSLSTALVFGSLLLVIGVVAFLTRRTNLRLGTGTADAAPGVARLNAVMSFLPFITLVFAAFVPLAAAVYLATTTTWTLVERALLRRRYWGESGTAARTVTA